MVADGKREKEKKNGKNMQRKMLVGFALSVTNFFHVYIVKEKLLGRNGQVNNICSFSG
jgi:hypothetical protein